MMKIKQNIHFLFLLGLSLILIQLLSCGKVSQEVGSEDKVVKTFNLNFRFELLNPTQLKKLLKTNNLLPSNNYFTVEDDIVYATVSGIKDNSTEQLTYGKCILFEDKKDEQINKETKIYKTANYNKEDLKISNSNYGEIFFKFEKERYAWKVYADKVKRNYQKYLIKIYTNKNKYLLKLLEENQTTGNAVVNLEEVTLYDTFLSCLYLSEKSSELKDFNLAEVAAIYSQAFFNTLNFEVPTNNVKKFEYKKPVFIINSPLLKELLAIYNLYKTDREEVIHFLDSQQVKWLNKDSTEKLLNVIKISK